MKIAIIGSRNFKNYDLLKEKISRLLDLKDPDQYTIISGGARGADTLAEKFAEEVGIDALIFPADWETHGKRAGFLRNEDIVKNADIIIAFWDGSSSGTKHSINLAKKMRKDTVIIYTDIK